jgi:hypothetical protein
VISYQNVLPALLRKKFDLQGGVPPASGGIDMTLTISEVDHRLLPLQTTGYPSFRGGQGWDQRGEILEKNALLIPVFHFRLGLGE